MTQKVKTQVLQSLFSHQPQTASELYRESNHHSYQGFHSALHRLVILGHLNVDRTHTPRLFTLTLKGEHEALSIPA